MILKSWINKCKGTLCLFIPVIHSSERRTVTKLKYASLFSSKEIWTVINIIKNITYKELYHSIIPWLTLSGSFVTTPITVLVSWLPDIKRDLTRFMLKELMLLLKRFLVLWTLVKNSCSITTKNIFGLKIIPPLRNIIIICIIQWMYNDNEQCCRGYLIIKIIKNSIKQMCDSHNCWGKTDQILHCTCTGCLVRILFLFSSLWHQGWFNRQ